MSEISRGRGACARRRYAAAVLMICGCGALAEERGQITGRLTFGGEPVTEGRVVFTNAERGIHMTAELDASGRFTVQTARGAGLPPGEYQVSVLPPIIDVPLGPPPPDYEEKEYSNLPEKLRDPQTSGMSVTVQPGENELEIDLQP